MAEGFEGLLRDKTRPSQIEPLASEAGETGCCADAWRSNRRNDSLDRRLDGESIGASASVPCSRSGAPTVSSHTGCASSNFRTTFAWSINCATWSVGPAGARHCPVCR
jgi:hypothetical protein